jgi:hypothetical protein
MRIRIQLFVRICLLITVPVLRICDTDLQTLHGSSLHGSMVSLDGSLVSLHGSIVSLHDFYSLVSLDGSIVSHHGSIVSFHSSQLSHFAADSDPDTAFHFYANSDSASQTDADSDPDPQHSVLAYQRQTILLKK